MSPSAKRSTLFLPVIHGQKDISSLKHGSLHAKRWMIIVCAWKWNKFVVIVQNIIIYLHRVSLEYHQQESQARIFRLVPLPDKIRIKEASRFRLPAGKAMNHPQLAPSGFSNFSSNVAAVASENQSPFSWENLGKERSNMVRSAKLAEAAVLCDLLALLGPIAGRFFFVFTLNEK